MVIEDDDNIPDYWFNVTGESQAELTKRYVISSDAEVISAAFCPDDSFVGIGISAMSLTQHHTETAQQPPAS